MIPVERSMFGPCDVYISKVIDLLCVYIREGGDEMMRRDGCKLFSPCELRIIIKDQRFGGMYIIDIANFGGPRLSAPNSKGSPH